MNNNSSNGHRVYVRRKYEAEVGKRKNSDEDHTADSPHPAQSNHNGDITQQEIPGREPASIGISASIPVSRGYTMPSTEASVVSLVKHPNGSAAKEVIDLYWRERFTLFQTHLKNLDHSCQEAYVKSLQSCNPAELSGHAVELEKRAIHLIVEEGREMQRVKVLNVLGKSTST